MASTESRRTKRVFFRRRGAEAIYLLGLGWRLLPIVDMLE